MINECLRLLDDSVELSPRVKQLRKDFYACQPSVCSERARLYTEAYKETEGMPNVIRRAKALEKILNNNTLFIQDNDLFVGSLASRPRAAAVFPEFSVQWIIDELNGNPYPIDKRPGDSYQIDEETKNELLNEILPYWIGKTHQDRVNSLVPEETWLAGMKVKGFDSSWVMIAGDGHTIPDYKKIINRGLNGVIEDAKKKLESLDLSNPEDLRSEPFLRAVIISCNALINYAKRYSEYAKALADKEANKMRKQELMEISRICAKVPAEPAETLREALQSMLFLNIGIQTENNGHSISFGRVDQYLYPFYQKDVKEGRLSNEDVLELLNCFWLKLNTFSKLRDWANTKFFVGNPLFQNLTIGGQTLDGKDAVNELSYLCLASTKKLMLVQPSLTVRYFNGTSDVFLIEIAKVLRKGIGMPALFNDEAIIPSMLSIGYSIEDAVDYGITGCVEPSPQGKIGGRFGAGFPNALKMVEIALYGGRDPRTGLTLYKSKPLSEADSFEQVMKSVKQQMKYFLRQHVILDNIIDLSWEDLIPNPLLSAFISDCIARGKEIKQGGAKYDFTGGQIVGLSCAANALATLKKVVFDDKLLTVEQVMHALETNYEDQTTNPSGEEIRQILLNKGAKFGNDDPYVDDIAEEITRYWATEKMKFKNTRYGKGPIGGRFIPSTATVSANVPSGEIIGATPDGRKAGEAVSEGISAYRGTDVNGPTALVNSVGRVPNILMPGGQLLNVKLTPHCLKDEQGLKSMVALIKTLFAKKGFHIQFNVVDKQTLINAQKNPDQYKDLIVRVAGYSAFFVSLNPDVQQDIIKRTEHAV